MMKGVLIFGVLCVAAVLVYRGTTGNHAAIQEAAPGPRSEMPTPDTLYVRLFITKEGVLSMNGKESSFGELSTALDDMVSKHGVVLYSRDAPQEFAPHPSAKAVIDAVIQRKLPIRFCRKADFSD